MFSKCLFDVTPVEKLRDVEIDEYDRLNTKCKTEESRKAAYELLFSICKNNNKNLEQVLEQGLVPLLKKLPQTQSSGSRVRSMYYHQHEFRSPYGYCGIRNLGCICYMNAMLQHLFMTPTFR